MEIIRGRLSAQDFSNPALRYNAETNMIEYSPDGGVTWNPDPSDDPRHSVKFAKPLQTTGDIRCNSSASMVKWIKDFIDYETNLMVAGAEITGLANAVLMFFDLFAPWAILVNALIDLASTIFSIGATGLTTAFTSETYELLLCCFYCEIESDGSVTVDDFGAIAAKVNTDLNPTAALIISAILSNQGEMGLQNAGTLYAETGDCSDCECGWCWEQSLDTDDGGWTPLTGSGQDQAEWVSGSGWHSVCYPHSGTFELMQVVRDFGAPISLQLVDLISDVVAGTDITHVPFQLIGELAGVNQFDVSVAGHGGSDVSNSWTGSATVDKVYLIMFCSRTDCTGSINFKHMRFAGVGDNPFPDSNC